LAAATANKKGDKKEKKVTEEKKTVEAPAD
jgi:hypothetical protein